MSFRFFLVALLVALCGFLFACADAGKEAGEKITPAKTIALTFDDAPRGTGPMFTGNERAQKLIQTLSASKSGPVAFFVTTKGFANAGGKDRIRSYARAGHLIANHSHTHQWLKRVDADGYIADIDAAEESLKRINNRRPWYRFPYLDEGTPLEKRNYVRKALKERGLKNGYVTIDNYDWYIEAQWLKAIKEGKSVNMDALQSAYVEILMGAVHFYDEAAVETFGRSPAHVMLLHENDIAALFVDDFIRALRRDGWTIVSPDVAYADPISSIEPQTLKTRQGHVAALAIEAGRAPKTFTHLAIDENQIDKFLRDRNVFESTN